MKKTCIVYSCLDTNSGYGKRSYDFVRSLIDLKGTEWDIKLISTRWGSATSGCLLEGKDDDILNRIIGTSVKDIQDTPDYFFQITTPNEFVTLGKFNIGVTASIETTLPDPSWIVGCNRMDLILVSSKHGMDVLKYTKYQTENNDIPELELTTPIEVLFEGVDIQNFFPALQNDKFDLSLIKEDFVFLSVAHWLRGNLYEDRKNISGLVKVFFETFKDYEGKTPALLIKTSEVVPSPMDRDSIQNKINALRSTVKYKISLPSVYILNGDVSDEQMNDLYNNKKIKCMSILSYGEGFGRPLLEFSMVGKPVMTTGWSGQLDFLNPKKSILIKGGLKDVPVGAYVRDMIIPKSKWFQFDMIDAYEKLKDIFKDYKKYELMGVLQYAENKNQFSLVHMTRKLKFILEKYIKH